MEYAQGSQLNSMRTCQMLILIQQSARLSRCPMLLPLLI